MRSAILAVALLAVVIPAVAIAQSPTPTPPPTPPVTTVEPFPSPPQFLRAFPGPEEDSWYVYASGFTPRVEWLLGEVPCGALPCDRPLRAPVNDVVKEDGTMTFYVRLPKATDPSAERLLAAAQGTMTPGGPTIVFPAAGAPEIRVAGHNPGRGLGYPPETRTGIAPVDEIIALSLARDTAAIRSRVVIRDGTTLGGTPVRGIFTWQCAPYTLSEESFDQVFEYPAGAVYAVFHVPDDPALPDRYDGAAYGIAWYDGGAGVPLGGLTLVSEDGRITGTEIRCGTTPGYHVHHFTGFVLPPYAGPPEEAPRPPSVGNSPKGRTGAANEVTALAVVLTGLAVAATWFLRRPRV